jgi:hypothetical protein
LLEFVEFLLVLFVEEVGVELLDGHRPPLPGPLEHGAEASAPNLLLHHQLRGTQITGGFKVAV